MLDYLDDILIFSKSLEEHEHHLRVVLELLRKPDLHAHVSDQRYAKLSRCKLNKPELQFLGHILGQDGIKLEPQKIAVIDAWPVPGDVHQMRCFVGLATYFRRFVLGFSKLVSPATNLLRGKGQ